MKASGEIYFRRSHDYLLHMKDWAGSMKEAEWNKKKYPMKREESYFLLISTLPLKNEKENNTS